MSDSSRAQDRDAEAAAALAVARDSQIPDEQENVQESPIDTAAGAATDVPVMPPGVGDTDRDAQRPRQRGGTRRSVHPDVPPAAEADARGLEEMTDMGAREPTRSASPAAAAAVDANSIRGRRRAARVRPRACWNERRDLAHICIAL